MFHDTIAAIATPLAQGAISIIRLSGEEAISIANSIFDKDLTTKQSHTITYGTIIDGNSPIDEVLISIFRAPKTYTREDVVEINAHGGVCVTKKILSLILSKGARLARPGEFTERAFLNGRIDLSQAESVHAMVEASNERATNMAIYGIKGSVKKLLTPLLDDLLNLIATIEVNIDYPEYDDVEELTYKELLPKTDQLLNRMNQLIKTSRQGQLYQGGIKTVIAGKPNVGKSSLLNALLEEEKAIVTDIAGTTRDIVEGQIHIRSLQLNLIDTAGIRKTEDKIEQIGIEKSKKMVDQADLVLLVLDRSKPLEPEDVQLLEITKGYKRIVVLNKVDLPPAFYFEDPDAILLSAKQGDVTLLYDRLELLFDQGDLTMENTLTSERQIGLLLQAKEDLERAKLAMLAQTEPDLLEIDILSAHDHLKEIIGEVSREDLLDALFSQFCLGK